MRSLFLSIGATLVALALLAAPLSPSLAASDAEAVRAALSERSASDRESDASRKPADVLAWMGIRPGMEVADLMAGGGWYSEVLARAVGPKGRVYAQNNTISASRYGEALARRIEDSNLTNVTRLERALEDPGLPAGKLDAVMMVQFYHDTYWMKVDRAEMNRRIFAALERGGVFGVIDHRAQPGSGDRDVKRLHRVDPEWVKREVEAAGFVLEAESALLANTADDHTQSVFDAAIRGRTDRFALKFKKPE